MKKTVALASDHAGFRLKEIVKAILEEEGTPQEDFGTDSVASVDYPDYAKPALECILSGEADRGILVCGSGVGMSIVANKFPGIRAALVSDPKAAEMARRHNDANVLVLPGRTMEKAEAEEIVKAWLHTEFEGGRHQRRLDKVRALEESAGKGTPSGR